MSANCSVTQYGIPVLYGLGNLQDFFHSCCHSFMSHIVDGHGLCREFQTSPHASDLASPVCMFKRDAAPHLIDSDAHVVLFVDTWFMSCRVLKRGMENFVLNVLVEFAKEKGFGILKGEYIKTAKNEMVENHYKGLGFILEDGMWVLDVKGYVDKKCFIKAVKLEAKKD